MAISSSPILRIALAISSTLLLVFSVVTIYKCSSAAILLIKTLPFGDYALVNVLSMAGSDGPETHMVNLTFDWSSENFIWVTASIDFVSGLLGLARLSLQEWERRRVIGGMNYNTSSSRMLTLLSYMAYAFAIVSAIANLISAEYIRQHRLNVRQSTCHWQMAEHDNAALKCTRELAVCEVSPHLLKHDLSHWAVLRRQEACSQLTYSRESLVFLMLLSFVLVVGYGAQIYSAKREEKLLPCVEEKIISTRSSTNSPSRHERSSRSSWGSSDGHRVEKAE